MSRTPVPNRTHRRHWWINRPAVVALICALIGAAGAITAAVITQGSSNSSPDRSPSTSVTNPEAPPSVIAPAITWPANGFRTGETTLDLTISAAVPASGHYWYVAVQPVRQSGAYYFHEAVATDLDYYVATVGMGPAGDAGKGIYVISLVDVNETASRIIKNEVRRADYDIHGMALPAGAVLVDSVSVVRTA